MCSERRVARLHDELIKTRVFMSEEDVGRVAKSLCEGGICTLLALANQGAESITKLKNVSAGDKAKLRKILARGDAGHFTQQPAVPNVIERTLESKQTSKTVAADEVIAAIQVASTMRAQRPTEGPMKTIKHLVETKGAGTNMGLYIEVARLEAICGSMVSIRETSTALRCWKLFCVGTRLVAPGQELPPTVTGLLAWSRQFRVKGTYCNYLSKLALACEIAGVSRCAFSHPSIARAKRTIGYIEATPRPKMAISLQLLENLVSLCVLEGDVLSVLLCIISYAFMLRVPSEALPLVIGKGCDSTKPLEEGLHSRLSRYEDKMLLRLRRRKNKPHGTVLIRECWCARSSSTCPVRTMDALIDAMPVGHAPFHRVNADDVRVLLRCRLKQLHVACPSQYNTHDFRRGHARDLVNSRQSTLKDILMMGQWKSAALLKYLDEPSVEASAIVEAHIAESDSDAVD